MRRVFSLPVLAATVALSAIGLVALGVLALDRAVDNVEAAARQHARNAGLAAVRALRARVGSESFRRSLDPRARLRVTAEGVSPPAAFRESRAADVVDSVTAESLAMARASEAEGRPSEGLALLDRALARTDRSDADRARLCAHAMWIAERSGTRALAESFRARLRPGPIPARVATSAALFDVNCAQVPRPQMLARVSELEETLGHAVLASMRRALAETRAEPDVRATVSSSIEALEERLVHAARLRRGLARARSRAARLRASRSMLVEGFVTRAGDRSFDELLVYYPREDQVASGHAYVLSLEDFRAHARGQAASAQDDAGAALEREPALALVLGEAPENGVRVFEGVFALAARAAPFSGQREHRMTLILLGALALAFVLGFGLLLWSLRRERAALATRSDFLRSITHEMRTPLASIRLFAETLAARRFDDEATRDEYSELIALEAGRLSTLVENALELGRTERGEREFRFEPSELSQLLQESVALYEPLAAEAGMGIELDASTRLELCVDPDGVRQVLANLFENARKYAPRGGRIDVSLQRDGDDALVRVRDYGTGIEASERERVFERFVRGREQASGTIAGAGLGLAIARGIAEAHGGSLRLVEPATGSGACFELRLPLSGDAS